MGFAVAGRCCAVAGTPLLKPEASFFSVSPVVRDSLENRDCDFEGPHAVRGHASEASVTSRELVSLGGSRAKEGAFAPD